MSGKKSAKTKSLQPSNKGQSTRTEQNKKQRPLLAAARVERQRVRNAARHNMTVPEYTELLHRIRHTPELEEKKELQKALQESRTTKVPRKRK